MKIADTLRKSVLQAAIQGKLTTQLPTDGTAADLLANIRAEKARLIKAGKLKKEKPLPPITDDEIPFDIPDNWAWVRLYSIVSILGDGIHGTPIFNANGNYFFINGNNLYNGRIIIKNDTKKISYDEYLKYKKDLNENSILVSINGTLGNVGFFNDEKIILGKSACYFNVLGKLNKNYLKDLLNTDYFIKYAFKKSTGSTIKNVSLLSMRMLPIPLPPLSEQQRIVERLEDILPKIDRLEQDEMRLETLQQAFPTQMKNALLQYAIQGKLTTQLPTDGTAADLLADIHAEKARLIKAGKLKKEKPLPPITAEEIPFDIPDNWAWVRLGKIGDWGAGATPMRSNSSYYNNGTIPWLKTGDLNDGKIEFIPEKITKKALEETSVKLLPIGSVLIAMYGATIGKLGILYTESTTNQACCGCKPFNGIYNKYLFYFLMANRKNFIELGVGGAQPNISKEKIINTFIPLPPLSEQQRIVERLESLLPLCENLG